MPPPIEITPAGPIQTSSLRETSDADLPASATSGRTPDQAEVMSDGRSGAVAKQRVAASIR